MTERIRFRNMQDIINARTTDFTGADLQGADLQEADLENYTFVSANFQGANLQGAYLSNSDLTNANLEGANLEDTFLRNTILRNANLRNPNMRMAFFDDTDLLGANLEGANLEGVLGLDEDELRELINPNTNNTSLPIPSTPWIQDQDCVGQEDPVTMESIPEGKGFRLEAENRCYDASTLSEMKKRRVPLIGPMTRNPFTPNDLMRIDQYIRDNLNTTSSGGKKRTTNKKRKTRKTNRNKTRKPLKKNKKIRKNK